MSSHFGILNIHKPPAWSSRECVSHIHRIIRPTKAGHAGTLDPIATGVLIVCVGPAVRLVEHIQSMPKRYLATFQLGRSSVSDDIESEPVMLENAAEPTPEAIEAMLPRFRGEIEQIPPKFSAVKVGGKRAYKLARKGEDVAIDARTITIHSLDVVNYSYPELVLEIECSSGTYVRSLGRDLARALGTEAIMSELSRTAIGNFTLDNAVPVDSITQDSLPDNVLPPLLAIPNLSRRVITTEECIAINNGLPIPSDSVANTEDLIAAVDEADRLIALLQFRPEGQLWPKRVFRT